MLLSVDEFQIKTLNEIPSKMGYYIVDNRIYASRCAASMDATVTNNDVNFYYNNDVFSQVNWKTEPQESLESLYQARAQQLREKYDYLIISYSAGSDSHNLTQSFIKNNIKFDELYVYYADHYNINKNLDAQNTEILNAGINVINWCNNNNIKVTYDNLCNYLPLCHLDLNWIWHNDPTFMISTPLREQSMRLRKDWRKKVDSGQSVAIVIGAEKPRLYRHHNKWITTFIDVINSYNWPDYHTDFNGIVLEAFYATPDLPELIVKQCHILKNHIQSNFNVTEININFPLSQNWNNLLNSRLVRECLYPYWKDDTFSTGKSPGIYSHKDKWLWGQNFQNSIIYFAGLEWINQNISKKFFNSNNFSTGGFKGIISDIYYLE